jgi:hypothetical protein
MGYFVHGTGVKGEQKQDKSQPVFFNFWFFSNLVGEQTLEPLTP